MPDPEQLKILAHGLESWNAWRREHPEIRVDLSGADLSNSNLIGIDLRDAKLNSTNFSGTMLDGADFYRAKLFRAVLRNSRLSRANFIGAALCGANLISARLNDSDFYHANLRRADLSKSYLVDANLTDADLSFTNLSDASVSGANLTRTDMTSANLRDANLERVTFVGTNLSHAILEGCKVYGISAWSLKLDGANQNNLRITPNEESSITVDNLEVAQFIYLMLNNLKVRDIITTITTKAVLILGRFTPERKPILDAIREELRHHDYLPILFDFDQPVTRDLTETISTLAHMARFIIADITDAKSIPQELEAVVPHLPSVPVQPILLSSRSEYGMFGHFKRYPWVLKTHLYQNSEDLIADLKDRIIAPAESAIRQIRS